MERVFVKLDAVGDFDDVSQIHDRDTVADVPNYRQVVSDEQVGQAKLVLQVFEQVDDLRLDRNVQGGNRLVAYDKAGFDGEGTSDADALPLPAAELVWIAISHIGVKPYGL